MSEVKKVNKTNDYTGLMNVIAMSDLDPKARYMILSVKSGIHSNKNNADMVGITLMDYETGEISSIITGSESIMSFVADVENGVIDKNAILVWFETLTSNKSGNQWKKISTIERATYDEILNLKNLIKGRNIQSVENPDVLLLESVDEETSK